MNGNWEGKYWYNDSESDKTEFNFTIESQIDSKISGRISDNVEMGGTEGIGSFTGTIIENKIEFVKKMPIRTSILKDGTVVKENKPHHPIYYSGVINLQKQTIKGTWVLKKKFGVLNGFLAIFPNTRGKWEKKKAVLIS